MIVVSIIIAVPHEIETSIMLLLSFLLTVFLQYQENEVRISTYGLIRNVLRPRVLHAKRNAQVSTYDTSESLRNSVFDSFRMRILENIKERRTKALIGREIVVRRFGPLLYRRFKL